MQKSCDINCVSIYDKEDDMFDSESEYESFDYEVLLQKQIRNLIKRNYYECNWCFNVFKKIPNNPLKAFNQVCFNCKLPFCLCFICLKRPGKVKLIFKMENVCENKYLYIYCKKCYMDKIYIPKITVLQNKLETSFQRYNL